MAIEVYVKSYVGNARVTIPIYGLSCGGGGALIVERALAKVPGVIHAYVNPCTEMAYVGYDPAQCQSQTFVDAVRRAGFDAGEPELR